MKSDFNQPDLSLFFSRQDPLDPRLGDVSKYLRTIPEIAPPNSTLLLGYPDDEGIQKNGGRLGAHQGPTEIRRVLYRTTPGQDSALSLFDLGDLSLEGELPERHQRARAAIGAALSSGFHVLTLGGGHDYGYSDGAGFLDVTQRQGLKPLVINFDSHLDVRPLTSGPTSGTPFRLLLEEFKGFDFAEIGLQRHCNSRAHLKWCLDHGGRCLFAEELGESPQPEKTILSFLKPLLKPGRPTFLSVDIDAFSSSFAMGCSQSWPTGFDPQTFFRVFMFLLRQVDVRVVGLYEVSPPLDLDHRTAKLAAIIAHRFISSPFHRPKAAKKPKKTKR